MAKPSASSSTLGNDPRSGWPQLPRGPLIGSPCFEKPLRSYLGRAISSGQYCSRGLIEPAFGGKNAPAAAARFLRLMFRKEPCGFPKVALGGMEAAVA